MPLRCTKQWDLPNTGSRGRKLVRLRATRPPSGSSSRRLAPVLKPFLAGLAILMLAACGRQGDLLPPAGAQPADPRIGRYYESELDGPMRAPGDTEKDEGFTGVEEHQHRSRRDGTNDTQPEDTESPDSSGSGGGAA